MLVTHIEKTTQWWLLALLKIPIAFSWFALLVLGPIATYASGASMVIIVPETILGYSKVQVQFQCLVGMTKP